MSSNECPKCGSEGFEQEGELEINLFCPNCNDYTAYKEKGTEENPSPKWIEI